MIVPVTTSATDPTLPHTYCWNKVVYLDLNISIWTDHQFGYDKTSSPEITGDSLFCFLFSCEWNFLVTVMNQLLTATGHHWCCPQDCPWEWWGLFPQQYDHLRVLPDGRVSEISDRAPPASQNTDKLEYIPNQGLPLTRSLFSGLSCELLPFLPSWQTAIITQMTYTGRPRIINN